MRISVLTLLTGILLLSVVSCNRKTDCPVLLKQIEKELIEGNLKNVSAFADSLKKACPDDLRLVTKADSLSQIAERIALDFSLSETEATERLKTVTGGYDEKEKMLWEKLGWLEFRIINGEKRYFNRAPTNLLRIKNFNLNRPYCDSLDFADQKLVFRRKHTRAVMETSGGMAESVIPVEMIVDYTLMVNPDVVPEGEIVRCWLPWPKENHPRQGKVKFISASHQDYKIAPDTVIHRSIYMEAKAEKGLPVIFNASFSYQSSGQYFDPDLLKIEPYDKSSSHYREYTSEQLPHICFTENVRKLADSIAGTEDRPLEIFRRMYMWIEENIPWAGALEYSTHTNIPEYVIRNRRGDCGMQTFLLMSMLRYKGIPVRWQSGWMMPPGGKNLHDWCEVYFEGPGWIPVDISYGLQISTDRKHREFYMSGIDSYRLIVNEGVAGSMWPEKKFLRSDPLDFQRGEVEWKGGNLYYDKWDYEMQIEYLSAGKARSARPEYQMAEQD
ncbi:MAG: transglutaminase-like domain-containing protein [Bacteroidales bacterium]|jgi:transglutaminase-like putative cysteine protease